MLKFFIAQRGKMRFGLFLINLIISSSALGFQPLEAENHVDHPRNVVWNMGTEFVSNLVDIENKKLLSGESERRPWAGDYLPLEYGGIAFRFADPAFQKIVSSGGKSLNKARRVSEMITTKKSTESYIHAGKINQLSAPEKYDLLLGDTNQTLTRTVLADATARRSNGGLSSWQGHCDGVAAASVFEKRPVYPVTVTGVNGEKITFYPDDLKALMSLFWQEWTTEAGEGASSTINEEFKPQIHQLSSYHERRRTIDNYYHMNAAAWHLAVVNQLGQNKSSLIIDRDPGEEIWNHTLYSYEYTYFNLRTGESSKNFKEALSDKDSFRRDKFRKYRAKDTKYLVAVTMDVVYIGDINQNASVQSKDSVEHDMTNKMSLFYELEVNSDYEVVGGEWYEGHDRPDFVWIPEKDAKAQLNIEKTLGLSWDGVSPISRASQIAARGGVIDGQNISSQSESLLPLPHIFKALVDLSQKN